MQFVFLVGGFGTRLGEKTKQTPKPLLPIGGQPFLLYLVQWARWAGAHEILLLSGYLGQQIDEFAQTYSTDDVVIKVVHETEPLGTGGSLIHAYPHLEDSFIASNGDSWLACDPRALISLSQNNPKQLVSMALRKIADTSSSGVVKLDDNGTVLSFAERGEAKPGLINAGIYFMKKELFEAHRASVQKLSLESDIFQTIAQKGKISGLAHDGYFIDIGTPLNYSLADNEFSQEFNMFLEPEK
ncbi:putative D-glycero-alpha-D-manno-heptose 1-phosphate guanylyltransferase [Candidatus Terasakiella magnetica]|uniref:Putative D-glycero-alpha-D-manno-heptose 1-phosphate guanylyltransferase n=1 Tax=Candidatus Terasakiella magnetica TaxID=1867952 RepID=A0A1C3RKS3_9PROT|nr:sugar phosphate nucleotidyltransferase [Candidatus Terasakiella magnetica]SCA57855.1 putative D-glycero-alpha-D-manno-heptose 1-phosphate guanylyltransferase [Candidatus Terasakiella magnetica]